MCIRSKCVHIFASEIYDINTCTCAQCVRETYTKNVYVGIPGVHAVRARNIHVYVGIPGVYV